MPQATAAYNTRVASPFERVFTVAVLLLSTGAFMNLAVRPGRNLEEGLPGMQVVWACIYVVIFVLVFRHRSSLPSLNGELLLLLLLAWTLGSTFWSDDPLLTVRRGVALVCTTLFGVYFAVRHSSIEKLRLIAATLACAAGFSVFAQLLGIGRSVDVDVVPGWIGIYSQKNQLGQNMAFAVAVFLILRKADSSRAGWYALGACLTCVLVALSRSATAAVMVGMLILMFPICGMLRRSLRAVLFSAIAALLLPLYFDFWSFDTLSKLVNFVGRDATLSGRLQLWVLSVVMALQRPWLGYGYNAFWRGGEGPSAVIWRLFSWGPPHSHNGFLEVWLGLGIVGLAIFLLGFATYIKRAFTLLRLDPSPEARWPLVFLSLMFISNLTGANILGRDSLFWMLYVAVGVSSAAALHKTEAEEVVWQPPLMKTPVRRQGPLEAL